MRGGGTPYTHVRGLGRSTRARGIELGRLTAGNHHPDDESCMHQRIRPVVGHQGVSNYPFWASGLACPVRVSRGPPLPLCPCMDAAGYATSPIINAPLRAHRALLLATQPPVEPQSQQPSNTNLSKHKYRRSNTLRNRVRGRAGKQSRSNRGSGVEHGEGSRRF